VLIIHETPKGLDISGKKGNDPLVRSFPDMDMASDSRQVSSYYLL
jgi:hypothetical protein